MKKTLAFYISGILASTIPASAIVIAGWDSWDDSPNGAGSDTYDATVVYGVSAQAVGTDRGGIGWGPWANTTFNNGASGDGTWGTALGDVAPSTSTTSSLDATGLRNSTESGELTITITNTSGSALELASFHFDGYETRSKAPGDWTLSILEGSAVSEGLVASGVLPISEDVLMPEGGFDIDLSGLTDTTFEDGETIIFELAFTGGEGDGTGGQNSMIDNVAVMAASPELSTIPVDTIDHVRDNIGSATSQVAEYNTGSSNRVGGAGSATGRFIDNAILGFNLPTLGSFSEISGAEFYVTLTGTAVVDASMPDRNFSTDLYLFNAGVTPSELAPVDVLWNTDGLDERGNVSLLMGAFATPETEIGLRLMASLDAARLEDFYNEDGTPTQNTIWFRMNLDNRSTITTRYEYALDGAELMILPEDPDISRPFDLVIGAVNFRDDYYRSSWFGRFQIIDAETIQNGLGYFWTGAASDASSMFLWSYDFNQWVWTADTVYPYVYMVGDESWTYAFEDPDYGMLLWNYNSNQWVEHNTGWKYPFTDDEMAQRLADTVANAPHPRILLSLDDLPTLRENIAEGWLAEAYSLLKRTADQRKTNFGNSFDFTFSATVGRRMQDTIATFALVGYIEDDDTYLQTAIDFTLHQIRTYSYDEFANNNPGSPPLSLGDVVHGLAIAYDWLYPHMTTSERSEIHTALETLGDMLYTVVNNRYTGTSDVADSSNHNAVGNGGLGMGALALGDKPAWLAQAIRQVRRYLDVSSDAEGWNFEGRSYFNYGGWGGFPFASAISELEGPDLFAEQPKYNSVAVDYLLRQMPPYAAATGTAATMPFIMRSRNEVGLWTWLNGNGKDGNATFGAGGAGITFLPYTLLWADPDLQPLHPMDADLPLDKVFPGDRALFRDGWDPMDAVVTFTAGWARHPGHRVRSDNSFNFYALGERFAISPADAQTRMEVLNSLVMVDEPRRNRDAQEFRHGATFDTVETDEHFAYVKSDATESPVYYLEPDGWRGPEKRKVTHAMRHLLFARSPEGLAEPYMLIVDDLTARAESAEFSWLFQTEAQNTPTLGESGSSFQVTGRFYGNMLDAQFLAPDGLSNERLSHEGRDEIKGRWSDERINNTLTTISTSTSGKSVRFIVLLRAHEAGTNPPDYTFSGTETNGQLVVELSDGTTDTITINGDDISFSRVAP